VFFLFGTKIVHRDQKDRPPERAECPQCGLISDFRHQRRQSWFTAYFLPVFPVSKSEPILTCNRCNTSFISLGPRFHPATPSDDGSEKAVLVCPGCSGKLRVPVLEKTIRVTCPHCRDHFTVTVDRS
jgi:hypothetical protein